jgi:hypothetical protein
VERHALALEQPALAPSLRQAPVRADDPVPWDLIAPVRRQDMPDEARRRRIDVTVGLDEALGDRPDASDDALAANVTQ